MLHNDALWMKSLSVPFQKTAVEQYFPVLLFTMLYKVAQALESVDEILNVLEAC